MNREGIGSWLAPFLARPVALVGLAILCATIFAAIFAAVLAPYDPQAIDPIIRLTPPNAAHWFGTDQFGRDTLSRVIYSSQMALLIGVGVGSVAYHGPGGRSGRWLHDATLLTMLGLILIGAVFLIVTMNDIRGLF